MLPEEKRAVYVLAVSGVSIAAVMALAPVLGRGAWGGLGLYGLAGLTPLLFRKGEQKPDERDVAIAQKAGLIGGVVSYMTFFLASFGPLMYFIVVGRETISVAYLALIIAAGCIAQMAARSIAVLVLYHRGGVDGEE